MSTCINKQSILPNHNQKWLLLWFNCGHFEHANCWHEIIKAGTGPKCPVCQNSFPIVINRNQLTEKTTQRKIDQKTTELLQMLDDDPLTTIESKLIRYSTDQYPLTLFDIEINYQSFISTSYWKILLHFHGLELVVPYQKWLKFAVQNGDIQIVSKLLPEIININYTLELGLSYLHLAVIFNQPDIINLLIQSRIDINLTNKRGLTPLHYAVRYQKLPIVKLLLDSKADPNIKDQFGSTSLHTASEIGSIKLIELILLYHPDITIQNNQKQTAYDLAQAKISDDDQIPKQLTLIPPAT